MAKILSTPGVYIVEKNAFPSSVVAVATAAPAFIGYTEKAGYGQKDLTHVPFRISSMAEFELYYGGGPSYDFAEGSDLRKAYLPDTEPRFLLFQCMKMFFANGDSNCYIVSVGNYASGFKLEDFDSETTENGVTKPCGLRALLQETEPTMVVIPEAVCLSEEDCSHLQQSVLQHCGEATRNRFAILDIYDGFKKRSFDDADVINRFRKGIGTNNLHWGAAYYPWLQTTIMSADEFNFTHLKPGAKDKFMEIIMDEQEKANLKPEQAEANRKVLKRVRDYNPKNRTGEEKNLHNALLSFSPIYKSVMSSLLEQINLLPPSAAMAGIYSMVDNSRGVFVAPANVVVNLAARPAVNLTNNEQEDLNVPTDGKAVNAIRTFSGQGVMVWGARTLDGNSQDWRYINVRRTVIFIEQSIKYAIAAYVFEPNTAATWTTLKAMITNFLTAFWQQGGLVGATPKDAFNVRIGLNETMTPQDILDGVMRITVLVAITRPAEFIVLNVEQQMQQLQ